MSGATALVTRKALYLYSYVEKKEDAAFLFVYFRLQYASTIGRHNRNYFELIVPTYSAFQLSIVKPEPK